MTSCPPKMAESISLFIDQLTDAHKVRLRPQSSHLQHEIDARKEAEKELTKEVQKEKDRLSEVLKEKHQAELASASSTFCLTNIDF